MTLFSTAHHDTHQQHTEHHASPGHVFEPEPKASENLPDNGLTFRCVTFILYAILRGDYLHISDYVRLPYVTFCPGQVLFTPSSGPSFQPTVPNHWYSSCCIYVTVPWKGVAFISAFLFFLLSGTINFSHNWKVHLIAVIVVWTTLTA